MTANVRRAQHGGQGCRHRAAQACGLRPSPCARACMLVELNWLVATTYGVESARALSHARSGCSFSAVMGDGGAGRPHAVPHNIQHGRGEHQLQENAFDPDLTLGFKNENCRLFGPVMQPSRESGRPRSWQLARNVWTRHAPPASHLHLAARIATTGEARFALCELY